MPPKKTEKHSEKIAPVKAASEKAAPKAAASSAADPALDRALTQIEKQFGKGAIMHLDEKLSAKFDGISTGAMSLDLALGGYGLPRGRVIELYGPESSGKTTIALHVIAEAQKTGGVAAFIDAEHALDPTWAKRIGVNLESLLVSQPDSGEQALNIAEMLIKSDAVDIIVIDSVAALIPQAEIQGEIGDTHVGLQARLMSQALRKLTGCVSKTKTCVIFINQIRMKIGVMFGNPETTPGGNALKFYSSVRLDIRRVNTIKDGDNAIGNHVRARVVKNKIAPPFREAEFDIMFNRGINVDTDLVDLGVSHNVIVKQGAWLSYGNSHIGQGRDKAAEFLKTNAAIRKEIQKKIFEAVTTAETKDAKSDTAKPKAKSD